jgi:hypothetical protein
MIIDLFELRENKPRQPVPGLANLFCLGCVVTVADFLPPDQMSTVSLEAIILFRFFCQKRIKPGKSRTHS